MTDTTSPGDALGPLDGRYAPRTRDMAHAMSEAALMRARVRVEVEWFLALAAEPAVPELAPVAGDGVAALRALYKGFDAETYARIKAIEATTNHDVKAVEYVVKQAVAGIGRGADAEFVHFACTSEDINNIAHALMLRDALEGAWLPRLDAVIGRLREMAERWAALPMLARTHGQAATPTTLGKEMAVHAARLRRAGEAVRLVPLRAKLNGATGTFAAHALAYPEVDWPALSRRFVEGFGLTHNPLTTQIEPHDDMAAAFHAVCRAGAIGTDLSVDAWLYVSLGLFRQRAVAGEVGSSTMPHKVNPIDFENAESNFGLAGATLGHLANVLPRSRMQRDLSDSSSIRNVGVGLGHSALALDSLLRGLGKLEADEARLAADLDANWEVLGEGVQTVMRRHGMTEPYERMKALTRGQRLTPGAYRDFVDGLELPEVAKARLRALTPATYTGLAADLARASLDAG